MSLESTSPPPAIDHPTRCSCALIPLPAAKIHTVDGTEMCTGPSEESSPGDDEEDQDKDSEKPLMDDAELGTLLWDVFADYDPLLSDLSDLCA